MRSTLIALLLLVPAPAHADGYDRGAGGTPPAGREVSDAQFDKRLPPVLPGETVSDGHRKMKVWSSSGPVPVSEAPEPWRDREQERAIIEGGAIIVDQRTDERR